MYALSTPVSAIVETLKTNKALDRRISAAFHYVLANTAGALTIQADKMQPPQVKLERDKDGYLLHLRLPFHVGGDVSAYSFLVGCRLGGLLFVPNATHAKYGLTKPIPKPSISLLFTAERNNVVYFSAKEAGSMDDVISGIKPALGL